MKSIPDREYNKFETTAFKYLPKSTAKKKKLINIRRIFYCPGKSFGDILLILTLVAYFLSEMPHWFIAFISFF